MEELEWKVKAHAKAVDELLVSIEDLKKDRNECRTELEKSRAALQNAFIRQNTARLNIEAAQEKKDQTKAGVEDLKRRDRDRNPGAADPKRKGRDKAGAGTFRGSGGRENEQIEGFTKDLEEARRQEAAQTAVLNEKELM